MINTKNINEARKQIQKLKKENKEVMVYAQGDEFNRKILENKDVDIIIGLEFDRKDKLKQRNSGLNEVLCKLAGKNNIKIAIDIDRLKKIDKKEKSIIISRIIQNIKLCRRANANIILYPIQKKQNSVSFFLVLKGSTKQTKLFSQEGFIK